MLFCVTFGCMVWLLGESGIVVFWSASCISVHRPQQTAPKNYPILLCDISKDKRAGIQGYLAKYPCSLFWGDFVVGLLHQIWKERQGENTNWAASLQIKDGVKTGSSTSCAIGVVLHWREKLYFIVKGSSTASKGTKTVDSFRHPKPPRKQQKCH